ncbi:MAG: GNAT family N-acetyltransferase [Alphaproteobacteria bacterium]|nr:GNAT family N-acetyltransferase [Alphaproteobacteria bacterium]
MSVRLADRGDLLQVFRIIEALHREHDARLPTFSEAKAAAALLDVLDSGMCFVAEKDGNVVGSIGLVKRPYWFSTESAWSDLWFYVLPEHRGRAGLDLLRAVKARATDLNERVVLGVSTGDAGGRKDRLYRRLGFEPIGGMYEG